MNSNVKRFRIKIESFRFRFIGSLAQLQILVQPIQELRTHLIAIWTVIDVNHE